MLAYWQKNVAENFLPPISDKKRVEIEMRKVTNEPLKVKKQAVIRVKSASRQMQRDNLQLQASHQGLGTQEMKRRQTDEQYLMMSDHPSIQ